MQVSKGLFGRPSKQVEIVDSPAEARAAWQDLADKAAAARAAAELAAADAMVAPSAATIPL